MTTVRPPSPDRQARWSATRLAVRLLRAAAAVAAALALCLLLAATVLAWRLSIGPVDVTAPAVRLLARAGLPVGVTLRRASLAWDGWRRPDAPVILSLSGLAIASRSDHLDAASASFSPADLLRGRLRPVALTAAGGSLTLRRRTDGTIELAPGLPRPAASGSGPSLLSDLERVRLDALDVTLADERTGLTVAAHDVTAAVAPDRDGARTGALHARLSAGNATTALDATLAPRAGGGSTLVARLGAVDPSSLAALLPAAAGSAPGWHAPGWHAPVTLALSADLDGGLTPVALTADLDSAAGRIAAAGGSVPISGLHLHVTATRDGGGIRALADATLALAAPDAPSAGSPGPTVTAHLALTGNPDAGGRLAGVLDLAATPLPIPSIGTWWPPGLARGARGWCLQNLTAGTADGAGVHATLASRDGLAGLSLASLTGGFDGRGVDLHWLRPIEPITGADARLRIDDADDLTITLNSGTLGSAGRPPLDVAGTTMHIGGLSARDQPGDIDARIRGPLAAVLAILDEKRLHLLSRQPLPLVDPSGSVDARLHVALPLDDRVTMQQVVIAAHVTLAHVHLGDVALGHAIDDGRFTLDADTNGLLMRGDAGFAGLPVALAIGLDFRAGPPDQVTEHVEAHTRADAASVARASTEFGRVLGGIVALSARYGLRRDKLADLTLDADLGGATVATPFGWGKRAGPPATLHAALRLDHGHLASIGQLAASGPDLDIATHGIDGPNGPLGLGLDRVRIGRTSAAGRLDFPAAADGAFRLALSGSELDLAAFFARGTAGKPTPPTPPPKPNPHPQPWSARLDFDRIRLAHHVDIGGVRATLAGSGAHLRAAEATATGPVPMTGSLAAARGGARTLSVRTRDAGRLLSAFDVTDRIDSGSLDLAATLAGPSPDDGIDGTVRLDRFTVRQVPAIVLLLRDLTVYGLADPAPSPGISVSKVVVPFRWRSGVLTLDHARAWQPALGLTARGTIDTRADSLDLMGTIVPAYVFNTLPGRIPVLGRLFSPERGGGLFAATFTLKGPAARPAVSVNPLAALLPGMLRDLLPH